MLKLGKLGKKKISNEEEKKKITMNWPQRNWIWVSLGTLTIGYGIDMGKKPLTESYGQKPTKAIHSSIKKRYRFLISH